MMRIKHIPSNVFPILNKQSTVFLSHTIKPTTKEGEKRENTLAENIIFVKFLGFALISGKTSPTLSSPPPGEL